MRDSPQNPALYLCIIFDSPPVSCLVRSEDEESPQTPRPHPQHFPAPTLSYFYSHCTGAAHGWKNPPLGVLLELMSLACCFPPPSSGHTRREGSFRGQLLSSAFEY